MNKKLFLMLSLAITSGLSADEGKTSIWSHLAVLGGIFVTYKIHKSGIFLSEEARDKAEVESFKQSFKPGKFDELRKKGFRITRRADTNELVCTKEYRPVAPGESYGEGNKKVNDTGKTIFFLDPYGSGAYDPETDTYYTLPR